MPAPFDPATLDLLSAYLDNELAAGERMQVEESLRRDPDLAALLEQWKTQGRDLAEMPRFKLPADFNQRVVAALPRSKRHLPTAGVAGKSESPAGALAVIAALAALVLVTMAVGLNLNPGAEKLEASAGSESAVEDGVAQPRSERPEFVSPALAMTLSEPNTPSATPSILDPLVDEVVTLRVAGSLSDDTHRHVSQSLARSGVRVNEFRPENGLIRTPAWYVTATPAQFKAALKQAGSKLEGTVDAISLAQVVGASDPESSSGTALQSVRLYAEGSVDIDPEEAHSLDAWFGLAEPDERKRYLLIVVSAATE